MGRKRSTSFYGETSHANHFGQCDVIESMGNAGATDATDLEGGRRRPVLGKLVLSVPEPGDVPQGEAPASSDNSTAGRVPEELVATPKPIKRMPTSIYKKGQSSSLSVHQKVKILLSGRNSMIEDEGIHEGIHESESSPPPVTAIEECTEGNRPSDATIVRFRDILNTYNYTEGPHEAIELLANDCEWGMLSQIAAQLYAFFREQEDRGSRLSYNDFELKALVDDFLIRVFERDDK